MLMKKKLSIFDQHGSTWSSMLGRRMDETAPGRLLQLRAWNERKTRRRIEWSYYYYYLYIYFKFMKFFCFFGKPNVRKTNFFCEVSKNKNVTASKIFLWLLFWTETNKEHRPRGMSDLLPRLRFLVVLLASPRRRDDRSTLNFFQLDFYPSSASLIFSSSVPDRVWKSKFLYPFSFSFCESFS